MPPLDPNALASSLPPWAQPAGYVVLFAVSIAGTIIAYLKARDGEHKKAAAEEEHFDPEDLLKSSPFLRMLTAIETIAANASIQTEAAKTIAAFATAYAKLVEEDFDELRVFRAVQEALDREEEKRERKLSEQRREREHGACNGHFPA